MENSSQCEAMPRTPQSRKFGESASPRTPIKPAVSGKDGKCLLCGLDFKISGQTTWRSLKNKDLKDRVCRLLEKTPDFKLESTRLCKKFFRRIEALYKQSKDIEDSKREITEHYEKAKESNKACFGVNSDRFKRLAKQSLARARKEENGVVLTLQLTRNGAMTLAVYHTMLDQSEKFRNSRISWKP